MGDSITEGTIVDIPVGPGDYVNEDDVVLVLETDKVSVDVRAPEAGAIVEIMGEVDNVVEVGSGLYRLDTDAVATAGGGIKKIEAAPTPAAPVAEKVEAPAPAVVAPPPPASEKKASPPSPAFPVMESVATSLGNRPERRSKMSRMR